MRILTSDFVNHYAGRMMNVHPSLLPKYTGLNTHQRVLNAGDNEHGASIHFVTDELDGGPVIIQARLAVLSDDNVESLTTRVQQLEHQIYPVAIQWFAEKRIALKDKHILFDNRPLTEPLAYNPHISTT